MRCPKCRYLSFEPEPRCKNCGYDLSFGPDDLVIKAADAPNRPLSDFDLHRRDEPKSSKPIARPLAPLPLRLDPQPGAAVKASGAVGLEEPPLKLEPVQSPAAAATRVSTSDLPLFVRALLDRESG